MDEEKAKKYPNLKKNWVKGRKNPNAGRKPKPETREIDKLALEKLGEMFDQRIAVKMQHEDGTPGTYDDIIDIIIDRAFLRINSRGEQGNLSWAKFFFSYRFGLPPTELKIEHTNVVEQQRLQIEQAAEEASNEVMRIIAAEAVEVESVPVEVEDAQVSD